MSEVGIRGTEFRALERDGFWLIVVTKGNEIRSTNLLYELSVVKTMGSVSFVCTGGPGPTIRCWAALFGFRSGWTIPRRLKTISGRGVDASGANNRL